MAFQVNVDGQWREVSHVVAEVTVSETTKKGRNPGGVTDWILLLQDPDNPNESFVQQGKSTRAVTLYRDRGGIQHISDGEITFRITGAGKGRWNTRVQMRARLAGGTREVVLADMKIAGDNVAELTPGTRYALPSTDEKNVIVAFQEN